MKALSLQLRFALCIIQTLNSKTSKFLLSKISPKFVPNNNGQSFIKKGPLRGFCVLILFFILSSLSVSAQPSHPCYDEDKQPNCTASDYVVDSIYLASTISGIPLEIGDCDSENATQTYLCITVTNNTNSDREGLYVAADLSKGGNDLLVEYCFDEMIISKTKATYCATEATLLDWNCTDEIILTGTIIIWPNASGQLCPGNIIDCMVTTASKCTKELFVIIPPVSDPLFVVDCDENDDLLATFSYIAPAESMPVVDFAWDFGDCSGTSDAEEPSYLYDSHGQYYVELIVEESDGVLDTIIQLFDTNICEFIDPSPLELTCNDDILVDLDPCICETAIDFEDAFTFDLCNAIDFVTISRTDDTGINSGDAVPVGQYTISYEIVDVLGNTGSCSFDIGINSTDPGALNCNGSQNISVNIDCQATVSPAMIVKDPECDLDSYIITIIDAQGNQLPDNTVPSSYLGQTLTVRAGYECFDNYCETTIFIEDKMPPMLNCSDITISCGQAIVFPLPEVSDNCSDFTVVRLNEIISDVSCEDPEIDKIITRTIGVKDSDGKIVETCEQDLKIAKFDIEEVEAPQERVSMYCGSEFATDENGNPDPAVTGAPALDGIDLWPLGDVLCNVSLSYEDTPLQGSTCLKQIVRRWTVLNWYCGGDGMTTFVQYISLIDNVAPEFECPPNVTISSAAMSCETPYMIPAIVAEDACQENIQIDISYPGGFAEDVNGLAVNLDLGENEIIYRVKDLCGNQESCSYQVTVNDNVQPVAICESGLSFGLDGNGFAELLATTFDNGSLDECMLASVELARMDDACGIEGNTNFGPSVTLCCEDIGTEVMVILLVTDASGNESQCMSSVNVFDNTIPVLVSELPDITISNDFAFSADNLIVFGEVEQDVDVPGDIVIDADSVAFSGNSINALVVDNCGVSIVKDTAVIDLDMCGLGTISRSITISDNYGNETEFDQMITFINTMPFTEDSITWPDDITINNQCDPILDPVFLGSAPVYDEDFLSMVSYAFEDDTTNFSSNGCFEINRKWYVSDWCNRIEGSFAEYVDSQRISVFDLMDPIITSECKDSLILSYIANCGDHPVSISASAIDNCAAENDLIWSVSIDYDGDNSADYEGNGNTFSGDLPVGVNSITWRVEDGCGNYDICTFNFEIKSALNPQPFCLANQVFYINPVDTTGDEIADIDAAIVRPEDIDGGTMHPCGKDFTLSFSEDVNDTIRIFECNSLGQNPISLYATDEDGNFDLCNTFLLVQDTSSAGICGSATINGVVLSNEIDFLEEVYVELEGSSMSTSTDQNGLFGFPEMEMGGTYSIVPSKADDPLNGVSTSDLVLTQRHILGVTEFESAYQLIAADVNQSNNISTSDLLLMRKLILGIVDAFPNNKSWIFIPEDYKFIDEKQPWTPKFPEAYEIPKLNQSMDIEFTGLKLGDVNASVQMKNQSVITRSYKSFNYKVNREFKNYMDVVAAEDMLLATMLVELSLDQNEAKVEEVINYLSDMDFDFHETSSGKMKVLLSDFQDHVIKKGDFIMSIRFDQELSNASLSSMLFDQDESELSDEKGLTSGLRFTFESVQGELSMLQNSPNPWIDYTQFEINIPQAETVQFRINDVSGKQVLFKNLSLMKGVNIIRVDHADLPSSGGLFFYEVNSSFGKQAKKMMLLSR